jgi:hypothetical protein
MKKHRYFINESLGQAILFVGHKGYWRNGNKSLPMKTYLSVFTLKYFIDTSTFNKEVNKKTFYDFVRKTKTGIKY